MKRVLAGILVSALVAGSTAASAQQKREVSIGLASTSFATAAIRVANELGLFEKQGLSAKFTVLDSASSATTALIAKSVDVANAGPGEVIAAQASGQKVVVAANSYTGLSGTLVLSKAAAEKLAVSPSAPVAARLKALDGLIIASPSATGAYTVSFKAAATAAGANVRFTYMAQPAMIAALESGAIQGFVGGAPFWATPIVKGNGILWISGPKNELAAEHQPVATSNLTVMRDFADANPEIVKKIVAIMADLGKAIDERPADVKAAVVKLYPTIDAPTLDLLFQAEATAWKVKPPTAKDMAHEIEYVKSAGGQLGQIDKLDPAAMLASP